MSVCDVILDKFMIAKDDFNAAETNGNLDR